MHANIYIFLFGYLIEVRKISESSFNLHSLMAKGVVHFEKVFLSHLYFFF